jgi:hypothetical protein
MMEEDHKGYGVFVSFYSADTKKKEQRGFGFSLAMVFSVSRNTIEQETRLSGLSFVGNGGYGELDFVEENLGIEGDDDEM